MAHKFTKSRQLKQLLNGAEEKQKRDIYDFSKGHLNESHLLQHQAAVTRKSWSTSQKLEPSSMLQCTTLQTQALATQEDQMQQALAEFTMGTSGVIPIIRNPKTESKSVKRYRFVNPQQLNDSSEKISSPSLYSEIDDGILVEELPADQIMFKESSQNEMIRENTKKGQDTIVINEMLSPNHNSKQDKHHLVMNYNFLEMHTAGITRYDQYHKIRQFETNILRKKDISEQQVLSGMKVVEHHKRKLQEVGCLIFFFFYLYKQI